MKFVMCLWLSLFSLATSAHAGSPADKLSTFLRNYLHQGSASDTRYAAAFVHLSRTSEEVIVYIVGRDWCGSGGCTTLVLTPDRSSYRVVSRITIVQLPIRVLNTRTNGWHDIGVVVAGGGVQPAYEAMLRFDGRAYPNNPSTAPAKRLNEHSPGRIAISAETKLVGLSGE